MRRGAVVTGVLGAGTALVFVAAALAAALFPTGVAVGGSAWGSMSDLRPIDRHPTPPGGVRIDGGMVEISVDAPAPPAPVVVGAPPGTASTP